MRCPKYFFLELSSRVLSTGEPPVISFGCCSQDCAPTSRVPHAEGYASAYRPRAPCQASFPVSHASCVGGASHLFGRRGLGGSQRISRPRFAKFTPCVIAR